MANFEEALKYTLANEAGFSNQPFDRGGATNYGITQQSYSQYAGQGTTIEQLKNISLEDVSAFYYRFFWTPISGEQIISSAISTAIFDMSVNFGIHRASEFAQTVLAQLEPSNDPVIQVDGYIGPATLKLLNQAHEKDFINNFYLLVERHYRQICGNDLTQTKFLAGWLKRAQRLLTLTE